MPISIPRSLVELILLGPTRDRRLLQDSPILVDVWVAFAEKPAEPQEVLITPDWKKTSHEVATELDDRLHERKRGHGDSNIAYLEGIIAARLHFDELLRVVVPMTVWWKDERDNREMKIYLTAEAGEKRLDYVLELLAEIAGQWSAPGDQRPEKKLPSAFDRYAALAGLILWAAEANLDGAPPSDSQVAQAIGKGRDRIGQLLAELLREFQQVAEKEGAEKGKGKGREAPEPLVFQVSLNRPASLAIEKSVSSVKGDAARTLFSVNCSEIGWAVVDAGIQGNHPAFLDAKDKSRVRESFDFSRYRKIVSLDNRRIFKLDGDKTAQMNRLKAIMSKDLLRKMPRKEAIAKLVMLSDDLTNKRPIRWENVEPFVAIKVATEVKLSDHGTHVAGIIGAGPLPDSTKPPEGEDAKDYVAGMCPDINLYDFRVIADSENVRDTEFAIIAALQYIRHMNARRDFVTIHGANLSLSIPHDVHNFACGRTPVCVECERLIESGVVVVAAAGNLGYQKYQTKDGFHESYAAFSVTDPGNADGVITVGSTHRTAPHTYGVSFFSSRGPTGDGRLKPDIVAPGEKIRGPFREGWGVLDGTSMAAPHVSGAAAMIMARHSEMMKQPRRIKRILCETATDLGRERSFQGHGMLDVLRALQSI